MNPDEIAGLRHQVARFRERDTAHAELGTLNGFHEVDAAKNSLADYFSLLLKLSVDAGDMLERTFLTNSLNAIASRISELESMLNTIDQFAAKGVSTPSYPEQRTGYIADFKARGHQARQMFETFELYLRVASLERQTRSVDVDSLRMNAAELITELRASASEGSKLLANVRDKVLIKGIREAEGTFGARAGEHAGLERRWFVSFVIGFILLVGSIVVILMTPIPSESAPSVAVGVFKRLLLLSTIAVILRVTLTKYNVERNLRIIYAHRETVIAQFRLFESAIGETNIEAKNQLRLEIAKYIFTDPTTGYLASDSAEININPVISTIEKIVGRGAA